MSTKDELWQWLGEPLKELRQHRLDQPDLEWSARREFFLERLSISDPAGYPAVDALLRDLEERPVEQRDELLADSDELTRLTDGYVDQFAETESEAAGEAEFDQEAWWAFLTEHASGWNGTDEHWVDFEPWLLALAADHGFGEATESLLVPLRTQGAAAVRAVLAEYGVQVAEPELSAEPAAEEQAAEVELPTPEEFAEANMADLLAEDPDFAELSEERRMALIAEVLAEQNT
jgi:hypothetical protein